MHFQITFILMDFERIPKIENHLHLEGAIPYETLWQLIEKYGGDDSVRDIHQLKERFRYRDFRQFIETWIWKNQFIREYEDFVFLSEAVYADLANQNVKYAEVFISPSLFRDRMPPQKIVQAYAGSMEKIPGIKIKLIVDLVRDYGPDKEIRTLYEMNEVKDLGIIGVGIGGSEDQYPPGLFTGLYEQAGKFGFRTTAHAGEASGPESIWSAIRDLQVERIGHGTRAIEDPELIEYLAEHKIPLELCPLSNACTGVIDSLEAHPVRAFLQKGIPVSINTDDPKMFGNSLADEYRALKDVFKFNEEEITDILINSIHTMWMGDNEKTALTEVFKNALKNE
jgi:adenosine deaminase